MKSLICKSYSINSVIRVAVGVGMLSAAALGRASADGVVSDFTHGADSWKVSQDVLSTTPLWIATGGHPGGYIVAEIDPVKSLGQVEWIAPNKYRGNRMASYGGKLHFSMRNNIDATGTVVINSMAGGLYHTIDAGEVGWQEYHLKLDQTGGWHLGSIVGPNPTQAEFIASLGNVDSLTLHTAYGTSLGGGANALDSVELSRGPAVQVNAQKFVTGGKPYRVHIVMTAPAVADITLALSSSDVSLATVPATAVIPAGSSSVDVVAKTTSVSSFAGVVITASFAGRAGSAGTTLRPGSPSSLTVSPDVVTPDSTTTGVVVLDVPAGPGGIVVNLVSSEGSRATVPATVTVPAGAISVSFTVTIPAGASSGVSKITATVTDTNGKASGVVEVIR